MGCNVIPTDTGLVSDMGSEFPALSVEEHVYHPIRYEGVEGPPFLGKPIEA